LYLFVPDPAPLPLIIQFLQEAENQLASNGQINEASQSTHVTPLTPPLSPAGSPQIPMDVDMKGTGDQPDIKKEKPGSVKT